MTLRDTWKELMAVMFPDRVELHELRDALNRKGVECQRLECECAALKRQAPAELPTYCSPLDFDSLLAETTKLTVRVAPERPWSASERARRDRRRRMHPVTRADGRPAPTWPEAYDAIIGRSRQVP